MLKHRGHMPNKSAKTSEKVLPCMEGSFPYRLRGCGMWTETIDKEDPKSMWASSVKSQEQTFEQTRSRLCSSQGMIIVLGTLSPRTRRIQEEERRDYYFPGLSPATARSPAERYPRVNVSVVGLESGPWSRCLKSGREEKRGPAEDVGGSPKKSLVLRLSARAYFPTPLLVKVCLGTRVSWSHNGARSMVLPNSK